MVLVDVTRKAVELVLEYERNQGRSPKEVKNVGYDVFSDGLKIEVKGRTLPKRPQVLFSEENINAVEREEEGYRLYIVMNCDSDKPFLIILDREQVKQIHREKRQWVIPIHKKHYETAIQLR